MTNRSHQNPLHAGLITHSAEIKARNAYIKKQSNGRPLEQFERNAASLSNKSFTKRFYRNRSIHSRSKSKSRSRALSRPKSLSRPKITSGPRLHPRLKPRVRQPSNIHLLESILKPGPENAQSVKMKSNKSGKSKSKVSYASNLGTTI